MRVYKIVQRTRSGKLTSIVAEGSYLTVYQPGEWVQRKNMFVFLSEKNTKTTLEDLEVWECETTTIPRKAPARIPDWDHTSDRTYKGIPPELARQLIDEFFESPYLDDGPLTLLWCSDNTYLVDDIRLIRRVG